VMFSASLDLILMKFIWAVACLMSCLWKAWSIACKAEGKYMHGNTSFPTRRWTPRQRAVDCLASQSGLQDGAMWTPWPRGVLGVQCCFQIKSELHGTPSYNVRSFSVASHIKMETNFLVVKNTHIYPMSLFISTMPRFPNRIIRT
jgi:hypothetical protein